MRIDLGIAVLLLVLASITMPLGPRLEGWCYQLQDFEPRDLPPGCSVLVIDYSRDGTDQGMYSSEEIGRLVEQGVEVYAYLSIGEAEDYRFYWRDEWSTDPPAWLAEENPEWPGNYLVRYWMQGWREILDQYIARIVSQGFTGVYLDKVDSYYTWSLKGYDINWTANEMANLITWIRDRLPDNMKIMPQNGVDILLYRPDLIDVVDGWGLEDLFYNGPERQDPGDTAWRMRFVEELRSAGKDIYVVEYLYSGELTREIVSLHIEARLNGLHPYVAHQDRALDEIVVIPGIQPETDPYSLIQTAIKRLGWWNG